MRYPNRVTMCVSSQAGCGMACPFCATGQAGLTRNLSTAEIVEQIVRGRPRRGRQHRVHGDGRAARQLRRASRARLRRITDPSPAGLGIGQRHVTVSTVGLVPAIDRLIAEDLQVTLAVSLHAPDDELRDTLVPVNTRWKVAEVLDAAWRYADDDRTAGVDRVRVDPRHQRPGASGAAARRAASRPVGARQPDPAQPDARLDLDCVCARARAGVRRHPASRRGGDYRAGHQGAGDRRRLRPARGRRSWRGSSADGRTCGSGSTSGAPA